MKTNPTTLERILNRLEREAAELAGLNAADPGIRSEIDRLLEELGDINPRFFVLEDAQNELLPEQADKLKRLEALRGKLQLIPGVINQCEVKVATLTTQLQEAVETETTELRKLASLQLEEARKKLGSELETKFGGSLAAQRAIKELVSDCSQARAIHTMMFLSRTPSTAARQLIEVRRSLETPETAAHSTSAAV